MGIESKDAPQVTGRESDSSDDDHLTATDSSSSGDDSERMLQLDPQHQVLPPEPPKSSSSPGVVEFVRGNRCGPKPVFCSKSEKDMSGLARCIDDRLPSHHLDNVPSEEELWQSIRSEAKIDSESEPLLAAFLYSTILSHRNLFDALCFRLANKLANPTLLPTQLTAIINEVFTKDSRVRKAVRADLIAVKQRDPACRGYSQALLYFKGFQAIQSYRVAHSLWEEGRYPLALALQSLIADVFHVDIHPAARIGMGLMVDHAIGVVIGETAVIGDDCSLLHNVTLGGNGKETGDRHPKLGNGVLIGAHVTILGNITIGNFAKIGAGSVVLNSIPSHSTAVGVPARVVGRVREKVPAISMQHSLCVAAHKSVSVNNLLTGLPNDVVLDWEI